MKTVKGFKVGDKVFAKIKGYPAWPAIITQVRGGKYEVKFYGTGEVGNIKRKDIFYYLKHKDRFVKTHKRKDYNEAIEQIEMAVQESGTDGNEELVSTSVDSDLPLDDTTDSKIMKRKRSVSISYDDEMQIKKRLPILCVTPLPLEFTINNRNEHNVESPDHGRSDNRQDVSSVTESVKSENSSKRKSNNTKLPSVNNKSKSISNSGNSVSNKNGAEPGPDISSFSIVTMEHLQAVIAYAEHVRKKEQIYKKMPVENRTKEKRKLFVVKEPGGRLIGIKFYFETPDLTNEYDFAQYEESRAIKMLSYKTLIEQGSYHPEDKSEMFVTNLNFGMDDVTQAIEMELITYKKQKLEWLRNETALIKLDAKIKSSLGLDKADPKQALEDLNLMLTIPIEPLMLKKHPTIVDMVKRLSRYIGNVKRWNLTDAELEAFTSDAAKIRSKAEEVYQRFSNIFGVSNEQKFFDFYCNSIDIFREQSKNMSEHHLYTLSSEPTSRQAYFDSINEFEEMNRIALRMRQDATSCLEAANDNSKTD